jgi:short subunit dehydrogenase-like uncharacterized protein
MADWMLYGATGYTGKLIIEEAAARGHRPLIAGRSAAKLALLAAEYGLEYTALDLNDRTSLVNALSRVRLVLHAAGPFIHTSAPMLDACLQAGVHYLDITGEIGVFENTFAHDQAAKDRGIVLISGVGFDIVPSDCLVKHVADQLPDAVRLDVALDALQGDANSQSASAGTLKSGLEMFAKGNLARRNGELVRIDFGSNIGRFPFPNGEKLAIAIPWGDLSTGYRTAGIPNITTYMALAPSQINALRSFGYFIPLLLKIKPLREWVSQQIDQSIVGPTEAQRQTGKTYIYASVTNGEGKKIESSLETIEAYHFTAKSALLAIEHVLAGRYRGALTPASAFGADFVLQIEGTKRYEH